MDLLIKEHCYATRDILDLIGKIICVAMKENKQCVQNAIAENAVQILIKYLEKFKQKVMLSYEMY